MRKIPFPQANNIDLIFKILCEFDEQGVSKFMLKNKYGLTEREGVYYLDALNYLGLIDKIHIKYFINKKGIYIKNNINNQKKLFIRCVLNQEFISELYIKTYNLPTKKEKQNYIALRIMKEEGLNINTSQRRASTIMSWFLWIEKNM